MGVNRKLKGARAEYGLTQTDLASLLSISEKSYVNKENGKTEFTQSEIEKILDIFEGKKYEELFLNIS